MTVEIALWVFATALLPAVGFCVYVLAAVKEMRPKVDEMHSKLVPVLDNPDASGFGTNTLDRIIQNNTDAIKHNTEVIRELGHYVKWAAEQMTGRNPPPPVRE